MWIPGNVVQNLEPPLSSCCKDSLVRPSCTLLERMFRSLRGKDVLVKGLCVSYLESHHAHRERECLPKLLCIVLL